MRYDISEMSAALQAPIASNGHPSDDVLELFVMHRLDAERRADVGAHFMRCERCRARAMELGFEIDNIRDVLSDLD